MAPWLHDGGIDRDPSFGIKIVPTGESWYKCWSCNTRGPRLVSLLHMIAAHLAERNVEGYSLPVAFEMLAGQADTFELQVPDWKQINLAQDVRIWPEEYLKTNFKALSVSQEAVAYMEGRGIPFDLARGLCLWDAQRRRVVFPIKNWIGKLVGCQGRAIDAGVQPKYKAYTWNEADIEDCDLRVDDGGIYNKLPWLGEYWVQEDRPVVVTEGPMDLASISRVYSNVLSSQTAGLGAEKVKRLRDVEHLITFYDHGHGGDAAREALQKYRPAGQIIDDIIPTEVQGDAGAMSVRVIHEALSQFVDSPCK